MIPTSIKIIPNNFYNGIYYIGQYGTSGYATAAKGYLYTYFINGIPVTWDPLYFDDSELEDDDLYNVAVKSLIKKKINNYDLVILHCTPDLWPKIKYEKQNIVSGKIIIGYCTWESDKLPNEWVSCINDSVHEVWVPSTYNRDCFINSGVKKTVRVVPHEFLYKELPTRSNIRLTNYNDSIIDNTEGKYTFYSIGELIIRKGIEDLIDVYCSTFSSRNNVRLILKVHYKDYSEKNKEKCKDIILNKLEKYKDHPEILCIFDNLTNKQLLGVHSLGDCYVSLTRSEGFGLTIFDAYNYKKSIIATGYSGHMDFLGENYPGLVKYKIDKVIGMDRFSKNYTEDQSWAIPDLEHASYLMKSLVYINYV